MVYDAPGWTQAGGLIIIRYYQAVFAGVGGDQIDVAFPDFPGCVTVAANAEEAQCRAAEVLSLHVQSMAEDGDTIPLGAEESALIELIEAYEADGHRTLVARVAVASPAGKAHQR